MKSYSWGYKLLHWLMAALIILMFFALQGFYPEMTNEERKEMLMGHSSIGSIITLLLMIRLTKRFVFKHERPKHPLSARHARAAKLTHYGLYLLMVLVPVTGYLTANFHELPVLAFGSFNLNGTADAQSFTLLRSMHSFCVKALIVLVALHVLAALAHKLIWKDNVLTSMRPMRAPNNEI